MRNLWNGIAVLGIIAANGAAYAQTEGRASAESVVTVLPKSGEAAAPVPESALKVEVNGKQVQPSTWQPYGKGEVQMVLLIDNSARTSFGRNLSDLANFLKNLPPNVSAAVAYMQNGAAVFSGTLSKDHAAAAGALHLPSGTPGSNASPYFCLEDLVKHWPAPRSAARREVLMITDGTDPYNVRYDPENPYITSTLDAVNRGGLVVYSIYWRDQGGLDNSLYQTNAGQSYLTQVADATGGNFYYEGLTNPVSFVPFLSDLRRRLDNQYELAVPVRPEKKEDYPSLKVRSDIGAVKITAANRVAVAPEGTAAQ